MISRLVGVVKQIKEQLVIVDVGVFWLEVQVPSSGQWQQEESIELSVYMHWHQEQGPSLYGFATEVEKQLFSLIIGCSGVGPKLALAILGQLGAAAFVKAVQQEDDKALGKVSGVGPRKAEQLVVYLRHKIAGLSDQTFLGETVRHSHWQLVAQTLESLRYSRLEIARAVGHLRTVHTHQEVPFDQLVKSALAYLTKPTV